MTGKNSGHKSGFAVLKGCDFIVILDTNYLKMDVHKPELSQVYESRTQLADSSKTCSARTPKSFYLLSSA